MKKFFIVKGNFANDYNLYYCETNDDFALLPDNAERITRKEAIRLCGCESERRRTNQLFSGYAPLYIFPAGFSRDKSNPYHYGLKIVGRIAERI